MEEDLFVIFLGLGVSIALPPENFSATPLTNTCRRPALKLAW